MKLLTLIVTDVDDRGTVLVVDDVCTGYSEYRSLVRFWMVVLDDEGR